MADVLPDGSADGSSVWVDPFLSTLSTGKLLWTSMSDGIAVAGQSSGRSR
jgi:hypothetical protein